MQSIRKAASPNNINLIPHGWNTAIGFAADLQFQATVSDDKYCMVEVRPHRTIMDLLKHNPFSLEDDGIDRIGVRAFALTPHPQAGLIGNER